ncbi:MAG: cytochrome c3 family protein [Nitrospirota bacterium]
MVKSKNPLTAYKIFFLLVLFVLCAVPITVYSDSLKQRPHADKSKLPKGCASCHKGHGRYNTPMLPEYRETFCLRCHGQNSRVEKTRAEGSLARDARAANIQAEIDKPFHHPVDKTGFHRLGETLPETDPAMPRHAECGDCHHHHYVSKENKMSGVRGTNGHGAKVSVLSEYELCFNCHSYSANLPADQTNKAEMFNVSNPSFHPVIAQGKNTHVPSLIPPLSESSMIKCTDCHGNNDSYGPKGPHGSIYRYILSKNFVGTDGEEGVFQYELCYSCHRRSSILANESFLYHEVHISFVRTSCRTCHNPHGSMTNAHLIDFENFSIRPSSEGHLAYIAMGPGVGQCFLNCHGKDHNPAVYPPGLGGVSTTSGRSAYPSRRY